MSAPTAVHAQPVLPDYRGGCISNIVPAFLEHREAGRGWIPDDVLDAKQVVVMLIDGLGWHQLQERLHAAPTLASMQGSSITTVAPTTTSTALTSFTTGRTPGEHGIVGYRIQVQGELLNALRWSTPNGSALETLDPLDMQPLEPFTGAAATVVMSGSFMGSGLTQAHLRNSTIAPFRFDSALPVEVAQRNHGGDRFVYAYYDGIDQVAHMHGLGDYYSAELAKVDYMVSRVAASLRPGTALVVTADHGQVHVGDAMVTLDQTMLDMTQHLSGEARFQWLHARPGRDNDLLASATEAHSDVAWVLPVQQILDEQWFGAMVSDDALSRMGDVALVARDDIGFQVAGKEGPALFGRHGSMTPAELHVPLLTVIT